MLNFLCSLAIALTPAVKPEMNIRAGQMRWAVRQMIPSATLTPVLPLALALALVVWNRAKRLAATQLRIPMMGNTPTL